MSIQRAKVCEHLWRPAAAGAGPALYLELSAGGQAPVATRRPERAEKATAMPDQLTVLGLSAGGLAATLWSLRGRSGGPTAEQGGSIVAHNNIAQWHEDNKALFAPPICNKIMHKDDLTIMCAPAPRSAPPSLSPRRPH